MRWSSRALPRVIQSFKKPHPRDIGFIWNAARKRLKRSQTLLQKAA
jgi:hypothetical protein